MNITYKMKRCYNVVIWEIDNIAKRSLSPNFSNTFFMILFKGSTKLDRPLLPTLF